MPRRTKAIKKTDIKGQKAWLKKRTPSSYKIETKEPNKTILIVAEGQTEKLYFESFPVLTLTVEVLDLQGQSKLKLIESTENIAHNASQNYDIIWCVFDMDHNRGEKEFSDFDGAIEKAKALGYEIAYSNDVFELWFYLHFNYTDQQHHRSFYYKFLGKKWGLNYEKEGKKYKFCKAIYAKLEADKNALQDQAIERAEKLFKAQSASAFHEQNPVTLVYRLVRYLNEHKRR